MPKSIKLNNMFWSSKGIEYKRQPLEEALDEIKDKKDIYSTTETLTNKIWINNKPIYRKVFNIGTLPNAGTLTKPHGITNLDIITKQYGYTSDGNNILPLPYSHNQLALIMVLRCDYTNIYIQTNNDKRSYTKTFVILEYTKTN